MDQEKVTNIQVISIIGGVLMLVGFAMPIGLGHTSIMGALLMGEMMPVSPSNQFLVLFGGIILLVAINMKSSEYEYQKALVLAGDREMTPELHAELKAEVKSQAKADKKAWKEMPPAEKRKIKAKETAQKRKVKEALRKEKMALKTQSIVANAGSKDKKLEKKRDKVKKKRDKKAARIDKMQSSIRDIRDD